VAELNKVWVAKVESLQEIIAEISQTGDNSGKALSE
jgi:hypothetical protein